MLRISTDTLLPGERFEHWREVRGKDQFGVTIELAPEQRPGFAGRFEARGIGGAVVSDISASAYRVSRTRADIARIAGNSLCISLQIRGGGLLDTGRDRISTVGNGDLAIGFSDLPYAGRPRAAEPFHYRLIRIPTDAETMLGARIDDLDQRRLVGDPALSRGLRALFDALARPDATAADPARAVVHLARLALAARGRLPRSQPEIRAAHRAGQRQAVLAILARDRQKPGLAPAGIAAELGISVRQLHLLFEDQPLSFARTLAAARIDEAETLLLTAPALPVTEIAYACGFDSLATFYRAFRKARGMAPGDLRQAPREDRPPLRSMRGAFGPDA